MATIKSFTSLEQSRKLAEILPLDSADMEWVNLQSDDGEDKYEIFMNSTVNHIGMSEDIPAWSLASLLGVLPYGYSFILTKSFNGEDYYCKLDGEPIETTADNPVDACVAMIEKLHELKML